MLSQLDSRKRLSWAEKCLDAGKHTAQVVHPATARRRGFAVCQAHIIHDDGSCQIVHMSASLAWAMEASSAAVSVLCSDVLRQLVLQLVCSCCTCVAHVIAAMTLQPPL